MCSSPGDVDAEIPDVRKVRGELRGHDTHTHTRLPRNLGVSRPAWTWRRPGEEVTSTDGTAKYRGDRRDVSRVAMKKLSRTARFIRARIATRCSSRVRLLIPFLFLLPFSFSATIALARERKNEERIFDIRGTQLRLLRER